MTPTQKVVAGIVAVGVVAGGGSVVADNAINPYQDATVMQLQDGKMVSASVLEADASSTLPGAGSITAIMDTNTPRVELDKWDGAVKMGVTYDGMTPDTKGARPFLSKNVEWSDADQTMQIVPLAASSTFEDGGYEINIVLNSEPPSNVFNFSIDGADQLDFFYQAPLWQEAGLSAPTSDCTDTVCDTDGEGTSTRPENVVGSYAVYYKNHANHIDGQINYATGKAYHVFRPRVTDASGDNTWGQLSYSNGVMTLAVPQAFLDSAIYPITIDPIFGYTTVGGTNASIASDRLNGSYFTAPGDVSTAALMSIYATTTSLNTHFKGVTVASSSATIISNGITNSGSFSNSVPTWATSTFATPPTLTSGTNYILMVSTDQSTTIKFDVVANQAWIDNTNSFASPTDPTDGFNTGRRYSIYATYNAVTPALPDDGFFLIN